MIYFKKNISLFILLGVFVVSSLVSSCGKQILIDAEFADMLVSNECSCTFTVQPVCVSAKKLTFENICHAKCRGYTDSNTIPGRCVHSTIYNVCLDGTKTMTEEAAFIEIKNGRGAVITKYSDCDKGSY